MFLIVLVMPGAWVASKVVVMVGAKDVQSDLLIVRDVEQSLVVKEVAIL